MSIQYWHRAKGGDTVLDICCGSGDLAFLLSEKVGVDGQVFFFPQSLISNVWNQTYCGSETECDQSQTGDLLAGAWFGFFEGTIVNCLITTAREVKCLLQEHRVSTGNSVAKWYWLKMSLVITTSWGSYICIDASQVAARWCT